MPRPRKDGPKRVVRQLSDGSRWAYLYDRRTGEKLGQERLDVPEPTVGKGTIAELVRDYQTTAKFKALKVSTQKTYRATFDFIVDAMGKEPLEAITIERIELIKDEFFDQPNKANKILTMLSLLFTFAVRTKRAKYNPASKPGKLPEQLRTEIWSEEAEQEFADGLRPAMRFGLRLMLYTLQRLSDCLAMTKSQVKESGGRLYIVLQQQKTDVPMAIPVHEALEPDLRARLAERITMQIRDEDGKVREVESPYLLTAPRGNRWTRRTFSRAWDHDTAKIEKKRRATLIEGGMPEAEADEAIKSASRHRHDLRRTGAVRLAERGGTISHIASLAGWETDYCTAIIDRYVPRRTETALGAIELWESAGPRVVRLDQFADSRAQGGRK